MATKTKEPAVADQLLALLEGATAEDLEALDQQIAGVQKDLDSRVQLRRILAVQLGVEAPAAPRGRGGRAPATPAPAAAGGGKNALLIERRLKCVRYLVKNGAAASAELCRLFHIPAGSSTGVLVCDWFERTADGIVATAVGKAAAEAAQAD